ncbi:flavoprotein [Actinocorallia libanotica]|uniref:Flavoprotein n=1 Tax=Actinocorallia libanotica TaxID=46162 RepID=A0ABP4CCY7_9ACTN
MNDTHRPVLYLIVCAAGPASHVADMVRHAQERDWTVCVIATPSATGFIDTTELRTLTGQPVRSNYREPGENRRLPKADAVIVAPATYNTINKWAHGTADNYALSTLAELVPLGVPTAVLPFVNTALAANPVFAQSIAYLRSTGVQVLYGPGQVESHPPGTGGDRLATFPWHLALDTVAG